MGNSAAPGDPGGEREPILDGGNVAGMKRIVLVYNTERRGVGRPVDMARIQLLESAQALARRGYAVDLASAELTLLARARARPSAPGVRRVSLARLRWDDYDIVETNFHQGWETLERYGGAAHPFVVAKLGSVVANRDMPGIYFFGDERERMFRTQQAIHRGARFVTLLTEPARALWSQLFGPRERLLVVPGAAAADIPPRGPDPFPADGVMRVLFSGNVYTTQPEANRVLVDKLNDLGARLAPHARLYFAGPGDTRRLDRAAVTHLGVIPYADAWQHMLHAHVGIVVSAGAFMHNNESTKIYHYLRAGLPTVSESGFPNDHVVHESGLGLVTPSGDMARMAQAILEAGARPWNREAAVRYILQHHTWDVRMAAYDAAFRRGDHGP